MGERGLKCGRVRLGCLRVADRLGFLTALGGEDSGSASAAALDDASPSFRSSDVEGAATERGGAAWASSRGLKPPPRLASRALMPLDAEVAEEGEDSGEAADGEEETAGAGAAAAVVGREAAAELLVVLGRCGVWVPLEWAREGGMKGEENLGLLSVVRGLCVAMPGV